MPLNKVKVVLIGGAPGIGKTTLGRMLANRLDAAFLSTDDLLAAVKAVTTPESHPGLHVMTAVNYIEYFTRTLCRSAQSGCHGSA
jgi:2-phosphoglycerate kinase